MIKLLNSVALAVLLAVSVNVALAKDIQPAEQPVAPELLAKLQAKLSQARPGLIISSAVTTAIPGLLEVEVSGSTIYMTDTGDYFLAGQLFQLGDAGLVNITERKKDTLRAEVLKSVNDSDTIIFVAEGQRKARVTVFTDVDCGYCRKLHLEVPELNKRGIEVRYLAYPRAGIASASGKKIASAFCAKDKQSAMTDLKMGRSIEENVCENSPVPKQFALGRKMGVTGTPALVTDAGRMLPGYMPADRLAKELGVN